MPRHAIGLVVGLVGFLACFTGNGVTEIIGKILKRTGNDASILGVASPLYLASLLILHLLVPRIGAPAARRSA